MDNEAADPRGPPALGPLSHDLSKRPSHRPCSRLPGTCRRDRPWVARTFTDQQRENRTDGKAASGTKSPPRGTPRADGRHVGTRADPHGQSVFRGCRPGARGGRQERKPVSGPRRILVGRDDAPHSRPELNGKPASSTTHPVHAPLTGMARLTVTSPSILQRKPQSHKWGRGITKPRCDIRWGFLAASGHIGVWLLSPPHRAHLKPGASSPETANTARRHTAALPALNRTKLAGPGGGASRRLIPTCAW